MSWTRTPWGVTRLVGAVRWSVRRVELREGVMTRREREAAAYREREAKRREKDRTTPEVMLAWSGSRNRRRARVAREYWDAYQDGRPMSEDDR